MVGASGTAAARRVKPVRNADLSDDSDDDDDDGLDGLDEDDLPGGYDDLTPAAIRKAVATALKKKDAAEREAKTARTAQPDPPGAEHAASVRVHARRLDRWCGSMARGAETARASPRIGSHVHVVSCVVSCRVLT